MMGKWMLAFTVFWAYIGFDQYMLIWYANIPEENIYFIIRNTGNWQWLSFGLVLFRFFKTTIPATEKTSTPSMSATPRPCPRACARSSISWPSMCG